MIAGWNFALFYADSELLRSQLEVPTRASHLSRGSHESRAHVLASCGPTGLWYWSLGALTVYVQAAAERTNQTVEFILRRIAPARDISLA